MTRRAAIARSNETVDDLLLRAGAFRALAQSFAYPDDAQVRQAGKALAELASRSAAWPNPALEKALRSAARDWSSCRPENIRAQYQRLFLGRCPVSPHETAYGDGRRIAGRTAELADISGFYLAFGFGIADDAPDLPDHIGAELEFVGAMLIKLAYAGRCGWSPARRIVRQGLRSFLAEHLGRWAGCLTSELRQQENVAPYLSLADASELLVAAELRQHRIAAAPLPGRLPPDSMHDDNIACPQAMPPNAETVSVVTLHRPAPSSA